MQVLILHLDAPLMSFGGPQVDQIGPTGQFPTVSQMTGLFANALGYRHGDAGRLQALQARLSVASVVLRQGEELEDFQTVDLGQRHLRNPAWTTRGRTEHRYGGPEARYGTHIRFRRYRANASVLSAVSLVPAEEAPTVSAVGDALTAPARPLFIGRKTCLPAAHVFVGVVDDAAHLVDALQRVPHEFSGWWSAAVNSVAMEDLPAEWPVDNKDTLSAEERLAARRVIDRRDWRNQLHGGERVVVRRRITLKLAETETKGEES